MAEQNATGLEDIRHLLDRFPEDEATVRGLTHRRPTRMCHAFPLTFWWF